MKKKFALALALALTLSLTACKQPAAEPAASSLEQSVTEASTPDESVPEQSEEADPAESTPEQFEEAAPVEPTLEQPEEPAPVEPQPEQSAPVAEPEPVDLFTDTNETVYATTTVNIRSKPDSNSKKLGQLASGNSVTRTGVDTNSGWSEIKLSDGSTGYISSKYLTTTKPVQQTKPTEQSKPVEQKPTQQQTKPTQQKPAEQAKPNADAALTPEQEKKAQENLDVNIKEQQQILAETAGSAGGADSLTDGLPNADGSWSADEVAQHLKENPIPGVEYVEGESGAGFFEIDF